MKYNIDIEELKEIYLVSNTASYLLNKFSSNESILFLSQNYTTNSLIKSFLDIAKIEIEKMEELVTAYSLYVAIILKDDNATFDFLKNQGVINFEWFIDLRQIYFARQKPYEIFKIADLGQSFKNRKQFIESSEIGNTQKIEL